MSDEQPHDCANPQPPAPAATQPGPRAQRIIAILQRLFAPTALEVIDDSARHAAHAAMRGVAGGETHFIIRMQTSAFTDVNRVARARAVHAALAPELQSGLHALSLELRAPNDGAA